MQNFSTMFWALSEIIHIKAFSSGSDKKSKSMFVHNPFHWQYSCQYDYYDY